MMFIYNYDDDYNNHEKRKVMTMLMIMTNDDYV